MHIFKNEESLYETEGVRVAKIGFIDNQPTLNALESRAVPHGILPMLDEQVLTLIPSPSPFTLHPSPPTLHPHPSPVTLHPSPITHHPSPITHHPSPLPSPLILTPHPSSSPSPMESDEQVKLGSATDETFWLMARELAPHTGSAGSSALLSVSRSSRSAALLFTVSHYAGRVTYDTKGFVGKNGDKVLEDQRAVLLSSASALLGSLFDERPDGLASAAAPSAAPAAVGADRRGPAKPAGTIGGRFVRQLGSLMAKLDATRPQFVRCIKPNGDKAAASFDAALCQAQLTCAGVFEATAIKRSGLPFRFPHRAFVGRYRCCVPAPPPLPGPNADDASWAAAASALLSALPDGLGDEQQLRLGRTMVLYKVGQRRDGGGEGGRGALLPGPPCSGPKCHRPSLSLPVGPTP